MNAVLYVTWKTAYSVRIWFLWFRHRITFEYSLVLFPTVGVRTMFVKSLAWEWDIINSRTVCCSPVSIYLLSIIWSKVCCKENLKNVWICFVCEMNSVVLAKMPWIILKIRNKSISKSWKQAQDCLKKSRILSLENILEHFLCVHQSIIIGWPVQLKCSTTFPFVTCNVDVYEWCFSKLISFCFQNQSLF